MKREASSDVREILDIVRSGALGANILARDSAIEVKQIPHTREIRKETGYTWTVIFEEIYRRGILGLQSCVFRYPVANWKFATREARDVDIVFADVGALTDGIVAPCVNEDECRRLMRWGVSLHSVPETERISLYRICVPACYFLEVNF